MRQSHRISKLHLQQHHHPQCNHYHTHVLPGIVVVRGPGHEDTSSHTHHHRHPDELHQLDDDDHRAEHDHSADDHHQPLSDVGDDHVGGGEEDREADAAEEQHLVGDCVGVRFAELEDLGIDPAQEDTGQELPELREGVVLFHEKGAHYDSSEVEPINVHSLPPSHLPKHGEDHAP